MDADMGDLLTSHPTRVRGLKHGGDVVNVDTIVVAPHAGAWIETSEMTTTEIKTRVAPHAGAWIETTSSRVLLTARGKSHPTRVRGLKPHSPTSHRPAARVAPHAGAWIETLSLIDL